MLLVFLSFNYVYATSMPTRMYIFKQVEKEDYKFKSINYDGWNNWEQVIPFPNSYYVCGKYLKSRTQFKFIVRNKKTKKMYIKVYNADIKKQNDPKYWSKWQAFDTSQRIGAADFCNLVNY